MNIVSKKGRIFISDMLYLCWIKIELVINKEIVIFLMIGN